MFKRRNKPNSHEAKATFIPERKKEMREQQRFRKLRFSPTLTFPLVCSPTNTNPTHSRKAFDEMSSYGLAPSVITFNSLIDACARAGAIERARQVFSRMIAAGLRPNDRTFSVLIHSHARGGQVRGREPMRSPPLPPYRIKRRYKPKFTAIHLNQRAVGAKTKSGARGSNGSMAGG